MALAVDSLPGNAGMTCLSRWTRTRTRTRAKTRIKTRAKARIKTITKIKTKGEYNY